MLSPHEFATLMLVRQAPDQLDMNRAELDALLERQLVMLEHCAAGRRRAYLTEKGKSILDTLHPDSGAQRKRVSLTRIADDGARAIEMAAPGAQAE
jgi:DNA-binding MarR family transcriptional regulator